MTNETKLITMIILFSFSHLLKGETSISANQFYNNSWALIVGINEYKNVTKLNYAVEDAIAIKSLLKESFNFPEENIILILDDEATLMGIKKALKELADKTEKNDRVLVYFAGHGKTEVLATGGERGYLIPVNGDGDDLYLTSLPMDEVKNFSNMTKAKDVLFLMDACYSGLLGLSGSRGLEPTTQGYMDKIAKGGSRQVITAGRRGEVAIEKPEWGHSAFAKNLIKGLEDGMADMDSDGYITGYELGVYLRKQVTIDSEGIQTPHTTRFTNDEGEFVFINLEVQNAENEDEKVSITIKDETVQKPDSTKIELIVESVLARKNAEITRRLSYLGVDMGLDSTRLNTYEYPKWVEVLAKASGITNDPLNYAEKIANNMGLSDSIEDTLILNSYFSKSPTRYYIEEDNTTDHWLRYNRSEGLYLQLNQTFQSENIPGSSFYGGIGRAFHRNEYQWILGIEQLFWKNTFQFYFETFNKSITQDAWRMGDGDNSLTAIFSREDYFDWFNGQGSKLAGFFHIKNYISIGAEYRSMTQSTMNNVLDGKKFKSPYLIEEGKNISLKSMVSMGYPVDISIRDKFQFYSTVSRTQSQSNSDINYTVDNLFLNVLIPYTDELNFNIKLMSGASDVDSLIWKIDGFKQNIFELGGDGTLRGYGWKELSSSHFLSFTFEIWFDWVGLFYDRAVLFSSEGNTFNSQFAADLMDNISENPQQSIGLCLGDEDFRIEFARKLSGEKNTSINVILGTPLHFW